MVQQSAAEGIEPELLPHLLTLDDNEVILPIRVKREDVNRVKAVKLSDDEVQKVQAFQAYLFDRGYIKDNTFASLFGYLFNLTYTRHKQAADQEADQEVEG